MKVDGELPIASVMEKGPLGRVSVLFRIILVIPAFVVQWIINAGLWVLVVVGWFITLVTGWLPQSMHNGFHATIRFQFRVMAYSFLLQNRYPRGLFGDNVDASSSALTLDGALPTPVHDATNDEGSDRPESQGGESAQLAGVWAPPTIPQTVDASTPHAARSEQRAAQWHLEVTKGGRRILLTELVLGALLLSVQFVYPGHPFKTTTDKSIEWSAHYRGLVSNLNNSIIGALPSLHAKSPDWLIVGAECDLISYDLTQVETIPEYPVQSDENHLYDALGLIKQAGYQCSNAVHNQSRNELVSTWNAFLEGGDVLQVFLDKSGTIFVF